MLFVYIKLYGLTTPAIDCNKAFLFYLKRSSQTGSTYLFTLKAALKQYVQYKFIVDGEWVCDANVEQDSIYRIVTMQNMSTMYQEEHK